ncbi:MAG TPA: Crp/Fnr family transcriptional regulator [Clostridiales bacterium]|nr:Crp/Fnr family transcriptional regulator [Clostridiales bacterium]
MMDNFEKLVELLEKYFDVNIDRPSIGMLARLFKEVRINKYDNLIYLGSENSNIYFVVSGILRDYYIDSDGKDRTRFFISEGSMCGEDSLFIGSSSFTCTQALEDCVLLTITGEDFRYIISKYEQFKDMWVKALEGALAYKIKRENSLLMKNAAQRYMDFLVDYPELEKRIRQKYIASYLGITPVSLSRLRKTLQKNGGAVTK